MVPEIKERMDLDKINNHFGDIDLLLMDLILKGQTPVGKILDAGCGQGRNLIYFAQSGFDVHAIDNEPGAVALTSYILQQLGVPGGRVREMDLMHMDFPDSNFDMVICTRVLHFAQDWNHFREMWNELVRVLKGDGILHLTMDTIIGLKEGSLHVGDGKWQLPDGSVRFALTQELISKLAVDQIFEFVQAQKTIIYGDAHAETTLTLRKKSK